MNTNLLAGKTALITGATKGIGREIAMTFAEQGANIAITARHEPTDNLLAELEQWGGKARFYLSDASSFETSEATVKKVIEDFQRIDILVNNAGITRDTLLMRMKEEDWDAVININLKSVFNFTKAVQTYMLKQRAGSIINLSSIVGISGNAGQANYAASKAGIIGFTKSVAQEIGSRSIRCNAIAPGFIDTEMTQAIPDDIKEAYLKKIALRRIGQPRDVANAALFLASDLSAYVTGQVLVCDGGMN
ncbi:MAG: 3-oxoacyl-[Bacteroidales bacterium]|nr:3-oxoacyl-[acyl-carrier-protein] reductase [Bacteroidales bacterium]